MLLTNHAGNRQEIVFSAVSGIPTFGLRVAFQPSFWFTLIMDPPIFPSTIWAQNKPEPFPLRRSLVHVQANLRYQAHGLFFVSWKMWGNNLEQLEGGVLYRVSDTYSIQDYHDTIGSLTIGGAYVF